MFESLADFHFLRPWTFILLLLALTLYVLGRQFRVIKNPWRRFIQPHLLEVMMVSKPIATWVNPVGLGLWISLVWILALAGPTWQQNPSPLNQPSKQVLFLLELDRSMLTSDVKPNRLTHSKLKLRSLLKQMPGTSVALVVYAGTSHLVLPYTRDHEVLIHYLAGLHPDMMPRPGHDLAGARALVWQLTEQLSPQDSAIVLISDGDAPSVEVEQVGESILWLSGSADYLAELDTRDYLDAGFYRVDVAIDDTDVQQILRRLSSHWSSLPDQQDDNWLDMGYYLVWPLMLMMLFWFRRGMVISWD